MIILCNIIVTLYRKMLQYVKDLYYNYDVLCNNIHCIIYIYTLCPT